MTTFGIGSGFPGRPCCRGLAPSPFRSASSSHHHKSPGFCKRFVHRRGRHAARWSCRWHRRADRSARTSPPVAPPMMPLPSPVKPQLALTRSWCCWGARAGQRPATPPPPQVSPATVQFPQFRVPPQPSPIMPQFALSAVHVVGVQVLPCPCLNNEVPPPPQVSLGVCTGSAAHGAGRCNRRTAHRSWR